MKSQINFLKKKSDMSLFFIFILWVKYYFVKIVDVKTKGISELAHIKSKVYKVVSIILVLATNMYAQLAY